MFTIKQLISSTKKFRGKCDAQFPMVYLRFKLHKRVFSANAKVRGGSGKTYFPSIEWPVLVYDTRKPGTVRARMKNGDITYIKLPNVSDKCRVRCTCADFTYTFSKVLNAHGSLKGELIVTAPAKGTGKPRNPDSIPGMCKHLCFLSTTLVKQKRLKK